jgi:hypothetical protein
LHPLVSNDSGDERLAPHHSPRHSANNSADDDHEFEDEFDDEFEKESEEECEEECEEKFQVEPMMDKDEERGEESEDECERNDDETTEARAEIELDVKSISVPDSQLFDTSIDRQGVLDDIEKLFPQLALSNPKMASFVQELDAYIDSQEDYVTKLPLRDPNATACPVLGSDVDEWWDCEDGVDLHEPIPVMVPPWLCMDRSRLVKPRGSFTAPLMISSRQVVTL